MKPAQKPDKPWFLDAAFVIPLSIFIGYFWALSELMGEYTYFNIPRSFISLNPTTVLARSRPFLALIAVLLICFVLPHLFEIIAEKNSLFRRKERIRKEQPLTSLSSRQLWNYLAILLTLGAILVGYHGFSYMGKSRAETADTFYLVKQSGGGKEDSELVKQSGESKKDSELVFLSTYGDYLVVVPFDRDTNKFESFMILKMPQGDNTRLTFTRKKVGRLEPVQGKPAEVKR